MNGRDGGERKLTLDLLETDMSIMTYLLFLLALVSFAAAGDALWVSRVRPWLAPRLGWRDLEPDELIPAWAWLGVLVVTSLFFVLVPHIGAAAGY